MSRLLALSSLVLLVSCSQGETCTAAVSSGATDPCGGEGEDVCACDLELSSCTTESAYSIDCEDVGDGTIECDCYLDDVLSGSFISDAACESTPPVGHEWVATVNTGCGWEIDVPAP
ncbi:MAG: hypothetical protein GY913_23885 [Proteobacteria bacterium]|nr:hypothetical protein [Pseudomonadota bacterium]MCP4919955.1 hypothetical protein [Pseudomonadota bacterium]